MSEIAKGFKCKSCGTFHEFGFYVHAHWKELLTHTCNKCGARHSVCRGRVCLMQQGTKQTTATETE